MTTPAEQPAWMTFDEVSAFLTLPEEEVARLLLGGYFNYQVVKVSPNPAFVLRADVRIDAVGVREYQRWRWSPERIAKVDELVNRAAMKHGHHPTRTSPGVRGPAKTRS